MTILASLLSLLVACVVGVGPIALMAVLQNRRARRPMLSSGDLLVTVLMREREREAESAATPGVWGAYRRERDHRHSLRERLGFSLIQAGRALLRHGPAYAVARRRAA